MLLDSKDRTQTNAPLAKGESRGVATETEVSWASGLSPSDLLSSGSQLLALTASVLLADILILLAALRSPFVPHATADRAASLRRSHVDLDLGSS